MYQSFSIISIHPNYAEKQIVVNTSFDIDPTSVDESTVQLFNKANENDSDIDFVVKDKEIIVLIKDDIIPNSDYILRIGNIKNILGESLTTKVRRKIKFKSMIREVAHIVSPSNHEEIDDLKVTLRAILEDKEFEAIDDKTYFIQIAEDVAFINIVLETSTAKSTVNIKDIKSGQYYIRARVESLDNNGNKDIGKWSETTSFIVIKKTNNNCCEEDDNEPEYIEDVELINSPENGITPESIMLEFSGEMNPDFIDNIVVIRRDI